MYKTLESKETNATVNSELNNIKYYNQKYVLMFGKKRSGKTSSLINLFNQEKDAKQFFYYPTTSPQMYDMIYKSTKISFIDTPGFEINGKSGRNGSLKESLFSLIIQKTPIIHSIFFVTSLTEGIQDEDLMNLELVLTLFRGYDKNINFLITHTDLFENLDLEYQKGLILNHPKLLHMNLGHHLNVFFMGFPTVKTQNTSMKVSILDAIVCDKDEIQFVDTHFFKSFANDLTQKFYDYLSTYVDSINKKKNLDTKSLFNLDPNDLKNLKLDLEKSKTTHRMKKNHLPHNIFLKENFRIHQDISSFLLRFLILEKPLLHISDTKQLPLLKKMMDDKDLEIENLKKQLELKDKQLKLLQPKSLVDRLSCYLDSFLSHDSLFFKFLVVIAFFFIIFKNLFNIAKFKVSSHFKWN